ncbi:excalibur calcium-binding domain-containing protein [Mycobacterium sp.]|uniref:excalibur calcium-binding domain-containing protein n=1 Tax=Mycobacterium sp. TaxID=1785 RepID=UPI0039C90F00
MPSSRGGSSSGSTNSSPVSPSAGSTSNSSASSSGGSTANSSAGSTAGSPYYANCAAARAAGVAPLHRGDPGYRSGLDRDNDGIACE